MYYILFYKTVENYVELRAPFSPRIISGWSKSSTLTDGW